MTKMIEKLKAAIEAERDKLLAELPQAAEPRLSAIRKEIEACESLLVRFNRSRVARSFAPQPQTGRRVGSSFFGRLKAEL